MDLCVKGGRITRAYSIWDHDGDSINRRKKHSATTLDVRCARNMLESD